MVLLKERNSTQATAVSDATFAYAFTNVVPLFGARDVWSSARPRQSALLWGCWDVISESHTDFNQAGGSFAQDPYGALEILHWTLSLRHTFDLISGKATGLHMLSLRSTNATGQIKQDDSFVDVTVQSMTVTGLQAFVPETVFFGEHISIQTLSIIDRTQGHIRSLTATL
ncbi:hypothetical protein PUNSTDRAFT_137849 [Punctularia strigosozonata HHB-11173 SS5]|uniref:Uncharacterized protein n=1 Tax=Punctularia strigosozonata (strain HHB-11173) TaxID=741275 RepID=R7S5F3_PUNST|nr:uncharacterized protein PUNSTDRAFT_137849 [Punctularia strigosozonata HHB-11173 SS5]EIN05167.1 hypothetical protein PUNSTDRAFT_137849 [Punctularia strigosozonata HHB-11173 SS5]